MPLPIVNFGYTRDQLEITFINLTLNTTTDSQYEWDFGDGSFSSLKNPVHNYLDQAFYIVTLKVTNLGEQPKTSTVTINLSGVLDPAIMFDISKMIDLYSPSFLVGTIKNHDQKDFLIAKWQIYLQPLVEEPFIVDIENTHNSLSWPPLVNSLIAKLVIMDIILMNATSFALSASQLGANPNESGIISTKGSIKSIETGPSKVERYENKDVSSNSEMILNLSKAYQQIIKAGGLLDQMTTSVCQEAERVRIFLPMCGALVNPTILIEVGKNHRNSRHNANPFGISQRML